MEPRGVRDDPVRYALLRENCLAVAPRYDRSELAGKMLGVVERLAETSEGRRA